MSPEIDPNLFPAQSAPARRTRSFFISGLKTLLPTLVTLSLIVWVWKFLWEQLGRHLIWAIQQVQYQMAGETAQWGAIRRFWMAPNEQNEWEWEWWSQLLGVSLSLLLVYLVGLLVGNLIGRTFWMLGESLVMRIPVIRAIYPAVKQVTDFVLQERSTQFQASRVVACRPHSNEIWSLGLITGNGLKAVTDETGVEMVTVFIPSSPTAFTGYVVIVPRTQVLELPLKVEEAMRLIVSGGVLTPGLAGRRTQSSGES
ncbi:MAG: DUF502 domain-containing protein [Burkholderiales bacterium]|nr:DUF502 domain-containing protein [Phycisphaerae bacterium]